MFGLGPWEIGVILAVCVMLFGVGRLPEIGSVFGQTIVNFKRSLLEVRKIESEDSKRPALD